MLDVATGSGNAALAAARSGATVTGIDYVPELLERARTRSAAEVLEIDVLEGDAGSRDRPAPIGDTAEVQSSNAVPVGGVADAHPARYLLRARDLVDAHYAEPLDVGTLAREAGLSRGHFSAEFRRAFGETPHVYLLTRRLERAAALLRTTDYTVADICMAVGLSSVGSFTTSFGRMYGQTPMAYRASRPPASLLARIPACVVHAYSRPQNRTFREDGRAVSSVASISSSNDAAEEDGGHDDQDRQRATVGARSG